ncbi:GNAT family N-acetyltransferase [Kitasatospora sp. NPDC058406]|uniref:GNAT family N-acetyltransferase n=1 Tax=Kitasatospora sp. NPDC058406 TaxID=3346483 RepID=UPI0036667827
MLSLLEIFMPLPASPVLLTGNDLVLREWAHADLPAMVELFDDPDVAARTTLRSPFDLDAAREYLETIDRSRAEGQRLHLAITADGHQPLGAVHLNLSRGTMGYAVGSAHRGRGLALRAMRLLTDYAHQVLQLPRLLLEIESDNAPSIAVARALDFRPTGDDPERVQGNGRTYSWHTWAHGAPAIRRPPIRKP